MSRWPLSPCLSNYCYPPLGTAGNRAQQIWTHFDIQNLKQYHDHYLVSDVLLCKNTALRCTLWFCLWVCLHVGLSVCLLVKNEACYHSSACVYNSGASMIAVPCTTDFHAVTVFLVFCTLMVICSVCKRFSTAF